MYSSSALSKLTPLVVVVTLPVGVLAAVFISGSAALAVLIIGRLLLTPASAILFDSPEPDLIQEETLRDRAEQQTESEESRSKEPVGTQRRPTGRQTRSRSNGSSARNHSV